MAIIHSGCGIPTLNAGCGCCIHQGSRRVSILDGCGGPTLLKGCGCSIHLGAAIAHSGCGCCIHVGVASPPFSRVRLLHQLGCDVPFSGQIALLRPFSGQGKTVLPQDCPLRAPGGEGVRPSPRVGVAPAGMEIKRESQ